MTNTEIIEKVLKEYEPKYTPHIDYNNKQNWGWLSRLDIIELISKALSILTSGKYCVKLVEQGKQIGKQEMFDCFLKRLLKDFYGKHFIITEETLKEIKKRHSLK
jgi:hypothetical protein